MAWCKGMRNTAHACHELSQAGPVECISYCLLHFESLVKCKLDPKSTPVCSQGTKLKLVLLGGHRKLSAMDKEPEAAKRPTICWRFFLGMILSSPPHCFHVSFPVIFWELHQTYFCGHLPLFEPGRATLLRSGRDNIDLNQPTDRPINQLIN